MEKEYKFNGYTVTELNNKLGFEESYEGNDDSRLLLTNEVLEHEEEGLKFKYRYAIRVEDCYGITGDENLKGKTWIDLLLVVENESFHNDLLEEIANDNGISKEDVNFNDKHWYGLGTVTMLHDIIDNDEVDDKILALKSLATAINRLRGFHIDQPINMIGHTGWDMLHKTVNNIDF